MHAVPLFSFMTTSPKDSTDEAQTPFAYWDPTGTVPPPEGMRDPLFSDAPPNGGIQHVQFYHSTSFWIYAAFWSKSFDKVRPSRLVNRIFLGLA